MQNAIQKATANKAPTAARNVNQIINGILDSGAMRKRFDDLMGKRSPQFISSLVTLVNATPALQQAIYEAPMTVIQSALKAATYDLPIDPSLGYAYIVPFNNSTKNPDGTYTKRMEASFILGYKGMKQLAMRTGAYKTINVLDIREGELKHYNRLTEEIDIEFIEDEDEREALPIVGYVGYFKLINGTEKTIYKSRKQIEAHEKRHRKGQYMTKNWKDDFDGMAQKTMYRILIGKHGLMSIDYRVADAATIAAAEAIATGNFDDDEPIPPMNINTNTGEVIDVTEMQEVSDK